MKKSRTHARVSSHSRGERRQRLVHATRIIAIDARASFFLHAITCVLVDSSEPWHSCKETFGKMNLGLQTHRNGLEKTRRWSQNTSQIQTCLDVVKENPPKKPSRDPRRLASNSRLAVSLGTRDSLDDDDSYDERARRACILHRGDIFKFVRSSVFLFKRADIIMCTPLFFKTTTTDTSRLANSPPALVLVPRSTWPPSWNT